MNSIFRIIETPFEGYNCRFRVFESGAGGTLEIGSCATRNQAEKIRDTRQHEINKRVLDKERG